MVLTNPPFGTKKGGERPTRDDISFQTSNKQLNFLQVIYRSLKADGKARCAVVMPDNVKTLSQGMSLRDSARAGIAAAAITMADEATVSPKISAETLRDTMEKQNIGGQA